MRSENDKPYTAYEANKLDYPAGKSTYPALPLPSVKDLVKGVAIIWSVEIILAVVVAAASGFKAPLPKPVPILISALLSAAITFLVVWHLMCRKYRMDILKGLVLLMPGKRAILWSITVGLVGALIGAIIMINYGTGESFINKLISTPAGLAVIIVLMILLPPFEEIYYRGFLFPILRRKARAGLAVTMVVIWFGVAHAPQLSGDWIGLPVIVVMGLIWTIQRNIYNSLVPSIISHWAYNITLLFLFLLFR